MLHKIDTTGWTTKTAWCVPSAISFLTGISLIHSHSRAAFLQNISLDEVEGVQSAEALMLLREQGYTGRRIDLSERYSDAPKLSKFLKELTPYEKCMPLMIRVEDTKEFCHMIASHFGYAADNWTMKPVPADKFPHRDKLVTDAWVVQSSKK